MTTCTYDALTETLAKFGGVVTRGSHQDHGACCILEAAAVCQGLPWTDNPETVNRPDIRRLNDARWSSDALRTEHMVRLYLALEPWATWTEAQRRQYMDRVVIDTVRTLIAELPGLPDTHRAACRAVTTLEEARTVADAAADAAAAADAVLMRAVDLWIAAVGEIA